MTNENIAWVAGLFEGEGSFFTNTIRKRGKVYRYPCASVKMTDEDVIRKLHSIVQVGTINTRKPKQLHWKQNWTWRINGHELVQEFFLLVAPYLCQRRLAKGKEILETV